MSGSVLAFTDDLVLPVGVVFNVLRELDYGGVETCDPVIITQVSLLSNFLCRSDLDCFLWFFFW